MSSKGQLEIAKWVGITKKMSNENKIRSLLKRRLQTSLFYHNYCQ